MEQESQSKDLERLGKKLKDYLLAVKQITNTLFEFETEETWGRLEIDKLLQGILPALCQCFHSGIAFLADNNGKIFCSYPRNAGMVKKKLPDTQPVRELIEGIGPLVVDDSEGDFPELNSLNVRSLLIVRIKSSGVTRLVGVADGKNKPSPYLGEDKKFLNELMRIFTQGIDFGRKIKRDNLLKDYERARKRGDWGNLSGASEAYAKNLLYLRPLKEVEKKLYAYDIDTVTGDFLDAELCRFVYSSMPDVNSQKKLKDLAKKLRKRFFPLKNGNFEIIYKDNDRTPALPVEDFPLSALAGVRICLFARHFKKESEAKETKNKKNREDKKIASTLSPEWLWNEAKELLKKADPEREMPGTQDSFAWYVDWLRTKWQQIYYLARQGMMEPDDEKIVLIDEIYVNIHNRTIAIMREFLENETLNEDLRIDSDWLVSWLAGNVLLSKRLGEFYDLKFEDRKGSRKKGKVLNPISKMRYMKNLSHLILYVLHCAKHSRRKKDITGKAETERFKRLPFADIVVDQTSSLSQAQLYIISEYAYREIGVHRELRIFERLSSQLSHELPLYAASNFYRDHLYHVMDVCLLGELLLRSMLSQKKGTKKYTFMAETFTVQTVSGLLHNWYVAALCHDIGYVIEQSDKFLNPIAEIKGQGLSDFTGKLKDGLESGKKEIRETIKNIVESGEYVIPKELANKLIDTGVSTDHGAAAWLHLRQWMQEIKYPKESLAPALTAVLRHNLSDQEVDLHKEPLTFLLLLCDHIQEWGRPRIGPDPLARGIMEGLRFSDKPKLDRKVRMSNILINGLNPEKIQRINISQQTCENCVLKNNSICKSHCMRVQTKINRKKGIRFTLPHVEARDADFEPCISWLMFCRDLQSINYRKKILPFPISITLKHAPSRIWNAFGWDPLEMDIFEEYANTHSSATYLCEWIEFAKLHKEGIKYERDKEKGEEAFTIDLHELGRPLKRDLSEEHWKDFFRWKWQWLSHKYTTSNLGSWYPVYPS